jgi:hypothetical protein
MVRLKVKVSETIKVKLLDILKLATKSLKRWIKQPFKNGLKKVRI